MIAASNIHDELGDWVQGLGAGGIRAMLLLACRTGPTAEIDHYLHLFKCHCPATSPTTSWNIALNILAGGTKLQDIQRLRKSRLISMPWMPRNPRPTTAGHFRRRFLRRDVSDLMDAVNGTRKGVWAQQPVEFFHQALIDADGTLVCTDDECKGALISPTTAPGAIIRCCLACQHQGAADLVNRSGNRSSHDWPPYSARDSMRHSPFFEILVYDSRTL